MTAAPRPVGRARGGSGTPRSPGAIEVDNGARRATSAKHPVIRDCRTVSGAGLRMKTVTASQPAGLVGGIFSAASLSVQKMLRASALAVDGGLSGAEVTRRRQRYGVNAVTSHGARVVPVLWRQLRSPLLGLLLAAALTSCFFGEGTDAVIIAIIVGLVGRARLCQRVPGRKGRPGVAFPDPSPDGGDPRRAVVNRECARAGAR